MPIYEYECKSCGVYELNHKISEPARTACETCGSEVRRLISATAFTLKGGGWYADGYASTNTKPAGGSEKAAVKTSEPAATPTPTPTPTTGA